MCSPFSSMQSINLSKGGELRDKVLHDQREHAKVSAWISQIERWQRKVNKGMWIGEQPHKCGSWNLQSLQEMQRESYNACMDMCTEDPKDPYNSLPYRKRAKLNHTPGILHYLFENY